MDHISNPVCTDNDQNPPKTVACPYCSEPIRQLAIVCRHCGRDFYLFRGILQRLQALEDTLPANVRAEIAAPVRETASAVVAAPANRPGYTVSATEFAEPQLEGGSWRDSARTGFSCVFALTAAFALLNLVFNINEAYLRFVSIGLPLAFGFSHVARRRFVFAREALLATIITVVFLLTMTGIQAQVQGIRWAPGDLMEWREIVTYGCSILFAYLTGAFIARTIADRAHVRGAGPLAMEAARVIVTLTSNAGPRGERIGAVAKTLQSISSSIVIIGTALAAVWTGIGKLLH